MAFLEAQIHQPKTSADYKKTYFEFDIKNIHPIDQMEMHKQIGEMISSTLTSTTTSLSKLQVTLSNTQSQLKMENISSKAKDSRIKSLEDLVMQLRYNPSNIAVAESLVRKKNADIVDLRRQLKIPVTEDPMAKEIEANETKKEEMLQLIIK